MAFKYSLTRNHFKKNVKQYVAKPQDIHFLSLDDVIKQMVGRGSILKRTECYAVLEAFFHCVAENLTEGKGLKSEYLQITPGIQGVFNDEADEFDSKRHQIVLNVVAGKHLDKAVTKVKPKKISARPPYRPEIKEVYDIETETVNDQLSPGNVVEITGDKLNINPDKDDEGVFLIHNETTEETRISKIRHNYPKKLTFKLPTNLHIGKYSLEIRKRPYRTKALRVGYFAHSLEVST